MSLRVITSLTILASWWYKPQCKGVELIYKMYVRVCLFCPRVFQKLKTEPFTTYTMLLEIVGRVRGYQDRGGTANLQ